ncbi:MAG: tRNA (adenosine(37)-N6)-threonylcarbamoyltransferase complex dimerization subunit type 1 TsaB [Marinilabiliales bacterium]|nr:tRNA (adenosine(37)-N6)-threonylcarbamoyltransferase complex dimerization subunit type 1 TsaB [Marinilabiliales bacterium]
MAVILCIETSTEVCSVALSADGLVQSIREDKSGRNHAQLLTLFVEEVLKEADLTFRDLAAVAVSGGPGSYTGLRIGVSTAKGICYGASLPLITLSSTVTLAHHVIQLQSEKGLLTDDMLFCPMLDARRMEVYAAVYDHQGEIIRDISAEIIDHTAYADLLATHPIYFFGNGADKCRQILRHPNAIFLEKITASAAYLAGPSLRAFQNRQFADLAYYEPFYLKDFIATLPTKNIFKAQADLPTE